jgi:hypothetical protein
MPHMHSYYTAKQIRSCLQASTPNVTNPEKYIMCMPLKDAETEKKDDPIEDTQKGDNMEETKHDGDRKPDAEEFAQELQDKITEDPTSIAVCATRTQRGRNYSKQRGGDNGQWQATTAARNGGISCGCVSRISGRPACCILLHPIRPHVYAAREKLQQAQRRWQRAVASESSNGNNSSTQRMKCMRLCFANQWSTCMPFILLHPIRVPDMLAHRPHQHLPHICNMSPCTPCRCGHALHVVLPYSTPKH